MYFTFVGPFIAP
jgi:hypothetical protein